ncbi:MAG TPA: PepSY domain-containing protein [Candidatus Enterenecus merdae]|nr:PepSY domain-containing protein [Candidatus Enterenecus merdae]
MKLTRRSIAALCAAALILLAGCSQPSSQAEYIGLDAAKAIALGAAGVPESAAAFSTTGLDRQNGTDFYAIDFTANGQSYSYAIDAVTGVIINSQAGAEVIASPDPAASMDPAADPSQTSGNGAGAVPSASSNTAASANPNTSTNTGSNSGSAITADQARQIALNHAGLSASQVTFLRSALDWENGRQVYDVEFYSTSNYTEYDYEIDASTGAVLSYDYDAEYYTPPSTGATAITADQARQIALERVPGATTSNIVEFEVDRDDGRLEYEGTIFYNSIEYEFTIDGYSGAIRSWEVD